MVTKFGTLTNEERENIFLRSPTPCCVVFSSCAICVLKLCIIELYQIWDRNLWVLGSGRLLEATATYLWPSGTIMLSLLPIVGMCIIMNTLPITVTLKWAIYAKE